MKTLDDFYFDITEEEKPIVNLLRQIILDCAPNFIEKISYGVPYYFLNTRVCFIWPASVKPGPKSGVQLGFCQGNLLSNEQKVLGFQSRKIVAIITFHKVSDIRPALIKEIINEAILIDEASKKKK